MKQHQGSALITALFIMAIVAIAATAMAIRLQIDIRRTTLTLNADRSYALAQGVAYWAAGQLIEARKEKRLVPKIQLMPSENYENATLSGRIEDLQSRFNLNNLANPNIVKKQLSMKGFARLITMVAPTYSDQANNIAKSATEWVSKQDAKQTLTVKPPYSIAHRPMTSTSELRLVAGVTPELYQKLLPWVIALPDETNSLINLNTASKEVLLTINPTLTIEDAAAIIRKRDSLNGFKNVNQLAPFKLNGTLRSHYFLVHAHVELGRISQDLFTLLKQEKIKPQITTVWESRGSI